VGRNKGGFMLSRAWENQTWEFPEWIPLEGDYVVLHPLFCDRDTNALYQISHGTPEKESVWKFLSYGPFATATDMQRWLENNLVNQLGILPWAVFDAKTETQVGVVTLLNIVADHARAEIGHVWFTPSVHKTKVNTESQFLLLQHLFNHHRYRRVEWKCDVLNEPSRKAALRMGFAHEGRFRQHMVVRGRNRDTDYFAMTDRDWKRCKPNFEQWLYSADPGSLALLNRNFSDGQQA
jgi:RimJ/RimL family protein N-acetyltransferase